MSERFHHCKTSRVKTWLEMLRNELESVKSPCFSRPEPAGAVRKKRPAANRLDGYRLDAATHRGMPGPRVRTGDTSGRQLK